MNIAVPLQIVHEASSTHCIAVVTSRELVALTIWNDKLI